MKELDPAVRQYRHNTGEGFVFAYDHTETRKIVGTLIHQRVDLELRVLDLESEIESRDKRTDVQYHRNNAIRELLGLCDEEIAQTPDGEEFDIEHLARAVNKLKYVELPDYKQQRDELLAVLKSRPKHCEYCDDGGEGDIDIDKFIADVSAWAFKAKSAIKNARGE